MSAYRYLFDEKFDTYRKTPVHDWSSNYADAFGYMALEMQEPKKPKPKKKKPIYAGH